MSNPRIAFLEHTENQVQIDATQVTLEDPSGTWGIRESLTEVIAIGPGATTVHVTTGMYEFDISSLNKTLEYEIFWKVIDSAGNLEYIYGIISPAPIPAGGSGGPSVPSDLVGSGIPVDIDNDGYIDGYGYDLFNDINGGPGGQGQDGYVDSYDFDGDLKIDQVDRGLVGGGCGTSPGRVGSNFGCSCQTCGGVVGTNCHCTFPNVNGQAGGGCFDNRGVRIAANRGTRCGIPKPPPDGILDAPSPRGTPAKDGMFGNTFGFDGTSGMIPATGGERTDRAKVKNDPSPGYWNGLPFGQEYNRPIGPRGEYIKSKAHAVVRAMLKDTDATCFAFSQDEIDLYLESSLWAFNAKPTFTNFQWCNIQERWLDIISKGAVIFALYAQGLLEVGREFTINENGISFTPPPVSEKLHSYASAMMAHYEKELLDIKQNFRPMPGAVGIFDISAISPSLKRLRHLREKRIF